MIISCIVIISNVYKLLFQKLINQVYEEHMKVFFQFLNTLTIYSIPFILLHNMKGSTAFTLATAEVVTKNHGFQDMVIKCTLYLVVIF